MHSDSFAVVASIFPLLLPSLPSRKRKGEKKEKKKKWNFLKLLNWESGKIEKSFFFFMLEVSEEKRKKNVGKGPTKEGGFHAET